MRRSGLVDFSAEAEEVESSLSDGFGFSQERGRLRGGEAFSLLASVNMIDATRCDGRRLENGARHVSDVVPVFQLIRI